MLKKLQYNFPKMWGVGIKGRFELFRKFIRFGGAGHPLITIHHTRFFIIVVITAILIWWHNLQKCWRSWLSGAQNGGASLGATKVQVSPIILILSWHLSRLQLQKLIMALCFIQGRHLKCYSKSKLHIHSGTVALIFEKRPLEGL